MPSDTKINIFDLLSSKKITDKIRKISQGEINISFTKFQKEIDKVMDILDKRLSKVEKMDVDDMVEKAISKNDDEIRKIIRDETARIYFTLFVKRSSWK